MDDVERLLSGTEQSKACIYQLFKKAWGEAEGSGARKRRWPATVNEEY